MQKSSTINYVSYTSFILVPLVLIGLYGKYRCDNKTFKDPLEISIISDLDGWSVTHILFFTTLGYNFPNAFILSMTMGIIWEIYEYISGKKRLTWLGGCNDLTTHKGHGKWWYAKWSDILCNAGGFLLGKYLNKNKSFN
jgi:hypothetical protein